MKTATSAAAQTSLSFYLEPEWQARYGEQRGSKMSLILLPFTILELQLKRRPQDLSARVTAAFPWESMVRPLIASPSSDGQVDEPFDDALARHHAHRTNVLMSSGERDAIKSRVFETIKPCILRHCPVSLWPSIVASLLYPCLYLAKGLDGYAEDFQPLRDLWLSGVFPRGFAITRELIVMCR